LLLPVAFAFVLFRKTPNGNFAVSGVPEIYLGTMGFVVKLFFEFAFRVLQDSYMVYF